jgi:hypothetical protein
MHRLAKKLAIVVILLLSTGIGSIAQDYNGIWHNASPLYAQVHGKPALQPDSFRILTASEDALRSWLESAPADYAQAITISLPLPGSGYRSFRVWTTPMMEEPLAIRYAGIRTYTAEAVDNHLITAKLDYTTFGFHALVFEGDKTYLIDPYTTKPSGAYIVYYKKDYSRPLSQRMFCETGDGTPQPSGHKEWAERLNGTTRKSYRLALAADSEYCIAVAGPNPSKSDVLSKMVTSINRVNGVYERELAVTMVLIAAEDTIIFNTTAPDPYTNNSGGTMLFQNQLTISTRIGAANYDIGHVFSTGGGGIAQPGCVCSNGNKACGVTGAASPVGDAFDIDFVAHEMGHQFGAGHTFNANSGGSCAGNAVANLSYEPGSGSTIMAYAGICGGGFDFQAHSDAYFHSASLEQINTFITTGNGANCALSSNSGNPNATFPPFVASYNIPRFTPFELTAPVATDATADTLTYCWEQRNTGGADFGKALDQTHIAGPLFRSFPPTFSPTRVFPSLPRLLDGLSTPGEKLPDTGRSMNIKLTERDIYQGWGAFNIPDDAITLNVAQNAGPFTVTSFTNPDTLMGNSRQLITWDVAGTTDAPVSCATVDIYLSLDGGYSWPYLLRAGTPNDGSDSVKLPNPLPLLTNSARIKVKGNGNVFFNVNATNFTIIRDTTTPPIQVLSISPIPATTELLVQIPDSIGLVDMRMVNTLGQLVWTGTVSGQNTIPVAYLARGVYYLQLYGDKLKLTQKVLLR